MEVVDKNPVSEEARRIHNACARDREFQRIYADETRTRKAIIDAYLTNELTRDRAAELLVTKCHYGPQGAVEALNYAFWHRKPVSL